MTKPPHSTYLKINAYNRCIIIMNDVKRIRSVKPGEDKMTYVWQLIAKPYSNQTLPTASDGILPRFKYNDNHQQSQ